MELNQIIAGKYEVIDIIKSDEKAIIARCMHTQFNSQWIVKYLKQSEFPIESEALKSFDSIYIPKLVECFKDKNGVYFIMEYVSGIRLSDYSKSHRVNAKVLLNWMKSLARILKEVHGLGFVHGDIKPDNIIVIDEQNLALIDFGACFKEEDSNIFTLAYVAPERLCDTALVDDRSDIYSYGLLFSQLFKQHHIKHKTIKNIIKHLLTIDVNKRMRIMDLEVLLNQI